MSLALLYSVLLRTLSDPNLTAKGSSLTWTEEDTNFKILVDAIQQIASVPADTSGFEEWNSGDVYSTSPPTFVAYNGNIWLYINPISSSGVTPGTNPFYWELQSNGQFAHIQNTDQYLDFGGANQVSAEDIKDYMSTSHGGLMPWASVITYNAGDSVLRAGKLWLATGTSTDEDPGSGSNWALQVTNTAPYSSAWSGSPLSPTQDATYNEIEYVKSLIPTGTTLDAKYLRLDTTNNPLTGNLDLGTNNIENVSIITDSVNRKFIDGANRQLFDSGATLVFDIENSTAYGAGGSAAIEWYTRLMVNEIGDNICKWETVYEIYKELDLSDNLFLIDFTKGIYLGDGNDNTWRMAIDAGDLVFTKNESGSYNEKFRITA